MPIYAIADLHLSFSQNKPMDIFGNNWEDHAEKVKNNWLNKVKQSDYVIIPGDFSWAMYLEETKKDFDYLNNLPGTKILLRGNHDYWWNTVTKMDKFLNENGFDNISFLYNNSYLVEDKIIAGTRGWNLMDSEETKKMIHREAIRLKLSIEDGIAKYGQDKEIIIFMHYPPIKKNTDEVVSSNYVEILKENKVNICIYGHLHGKAHEEAFEGDYEGIDFKLVSADYLDFKLYKVK